MLSFTLVDLNGWGAVWVAWLLAALVDATLVLIVATLVWLAVRRKAAAALGSILFLFVLIKLVVPLEIPVPDAVAQWTPRQVASRWLADLPAADAESSPELVARLDDDTSRPSAEADELEITVLPLADESTHEPFPEPDFAAGAASPIGPIPDTVRIASWARPKSG